MGILKFIFLTCILLTSSLIGMVMANKYKSREKELKELKNGLNMFKTKIRYTYEPIPEVFMEIGNQLLGNVGKVFQTASKNTENLTAGDAWVSAIETINTYWNEEDKGIIKGFHKMLGKTDLEGQVTQINLTCEFLDKQIEKAEEERKKNEKLYKTLGTVIGMAIVIILI